MSVRALWIIALPTTDSPQCLFMRKYTTVDKRTKVREKENFVSIPSLSEFCTVIGKNKLKSVQHEKFLNLQTPVTSLDTKCGQLWPVLTIEQGHLLYCALPAVEQGSFTRPPLVQIPGVAAAFALLTGINEFLGNLPKSVDANHQRFMELNQFLAIACPFGTPLDVSPNTVKASLTSKGSSTASLTVKQPAWKPMQFKGKAHLHFAVREQVRATLYDKEDVHDVVDLHGTVMCRADLEGVTPEVSITFTHADAANSFPLQHVVAHPFVQSLEAYGNFIAGRGNTSEPGTCKVRFMPPLDSFALLHYTSSPPLPVPPVHGFYQMKLNKSVKNNFDYFEVQIPFFHRGTINSFDATPNHGNVVCSADKSILVWDIGQKFPAKTLEVMLKATVNFTSYDPGNSSTSEEHFCVGQNSYVQLVFKILDYTQTSLQLDTKSIQVLPNAKYKLTTNREFLSGEYRIWNSHGESLQGYHVPDTLLQQLHTQNKAKEKESSTDDT